MTLKLLAWALTGLVLAGCSSTQGTNRAGTSTAPAYPPRSRATPPPDGPLREKGPPGDSLYTPLHIAGVGDPARLMRVAVLLPFTSPHKRVRTEVEGLLSAIELALFSARGDTIVLLPKDTGGDPQKAIAKTEQAIEEGADLIIGPLFSASVRSIAGIAAQAGIPVLAFSTDLQAAGNGVYLLSLSPEDEVARIVDWVALQGVNRLALFAPRSTYGRRVEQAMRTRAGLHDIPVITVQKYDRGDDSPMQPARTLANVINGIAGSAGDRILTPPGSEDEIAVDTPAGAAGAVGAVGAIPAPRDNQQPDVLRDNIAPALDRFEESSALDDEEFGIGGFRTDDARQSGDAQNQIYAPPLENVAVLIPEGGLRLRTVAPLLPFFDVDLSKVRLLGTGLWNDPDVWREPTLIGGVFAAPDPRGLRQFSKAYTNAFGKMPPRLASLGYDAAILAIQLSAEGDISRASLERWQGFVGANGSFRFHADGTNERALAVLRITRRGDVAILEASGDGFLPPLRAPDPAADQLSPETDDIIGGF